MVRILHFNNLPFLLTAPTIILADGCTFSKENFFGGVKCRIYNVLGYPVDILLDSECDSGRCLKLEIEVPDFLGVNDRVETWTEYFADFLKKSKFSQFTELFPKKIFTDFLRSFKYQLGEYSSLGVELKANGRLLFNILFEVERFIDEKIFEKFNGILHLTHLKQKVFEHYYED